MLTTGGDNSPLAALDGAPVWLNSKPLTDKGLRGRVVLVDFWTYSCVNWLRTLPYVRAWFERYSGRGLVVIGVHAPEFDFERDLDNVQRAVEDLDVGYPVVIDNEFTIWRSFDNRYWPALYLLDGTGVVRFHHFGEEAYGEIERTTQRLLGVQEGLVRVDAGGLAEPAEWRSLHSEETYLGNSRGERRVDADARALALNQWSLHGQWSVQQEAAILGADGSIAYCFQGRDLNMVLTPPAPVDLCGSSYTWTVSHPALTTGWMSTPRASEPCQHRGCTSWFASSRRSVDGSSRSPSLIPVSAHTSSPSAKAVPLQDSGLHSIRGICHGRCHHRRDHRRRRRGHCPVLGAASGEGGERSKGTRVSGAALGRTPWRAGLHPGPER